MSTHLGYQYTNGKHSAMPFGFRTIGEEKFTGAAHVGITGDGYSQTISFPEKQFATDIEARRFAEQRVNELIDTQALTS